MCIGQHTSIASNRVKEAAMDIAEFHGRMRDKYAEKQQLEHRLFRWTVELLVIFGLAILVYLRYAAK